MKQETKRNCLQVTHVQPLAFSSYDISQLYAVVSVSLAVWDSTMTNLNCLSYNSHATELVKFDDKYSYFLGMYCLKMTKPCNFRVILSTTKCFDGVLKFNTRS